MARYQGKYLRKRKFQRRSWPLVLFILLCVGLIGYGTVNVIKTKIEYALNGRCYSTITQYISVGADLTKPPKETNGIQNAQPSGEADPTGPYENVVFPSVEFAGLAAMNPDVIGWIQLEDTRINYPIVQTDDNSYYLHRLFSKRRNSAGCLYADYRNESTFSDLNTIVYGHNMLDGSMFHDLLNYKDAEYAKNHPWYRLVTPEGNYVVEVFSVAILSVFENGWQLDFDSDEAYSAWLDFCVEKSVVDMGVQPEVDDRIVSLSTCTYEFDDARFVVYGILHKVE